MFNEQLILDTSSGPIVLEDQYLQVSSILPSDFDYYGLGETDKKNFRYSSITKSKLSFF